MDPKIHAELVRLSHENFEPANQILIKAGVPLYQIERGEHEIDLAPYMHAFEAALEVPLWPYNIARLVHAFAHKSVRNQLWPIVKKLLYVDWRSAEPPLGSDAMTIRAATNAEYAKDEMGTAMWKIASSKHKKEILDLLADESLGSVRVAFICTVRRLFKSDARAILLKYASHPQLGVEASHQLKQIEKKEQR